MTVNGFFGMRKFHLFLVLFLVWLPKNSLSSADRVANEEYLSVGRDLEITFVDSGQGDAIYILTPNKKSIVIDGGIDFYRLDNGDIIKGREIFRFLERNKITKLDVIILSHSHPDHTKGLVKVLNEISVQKVYESGYNENEPEYLECMDIVKNRKIPLEKILEGSSIDIDKDLQIEVFGPEKSSPFEDSNDNSIIFKLTYKSISFLFTGDAENDEEQIVSDKYGRNLCSDIMKAPHHGSSDSLNFNFLGSVNPRVLVISCGMDNPFGHPHMETLNWCRKNAVKIHRTDYDGNIKFTTNGLIYKVETYRD